MSTNYEELYKTAVVALEEMDYVTDGWKEFRGCRFSWAADKLRDALQQLEEELNENRQTTST